MPAVWAKIGDVNFNSGVTARAFRIRNLSALMEGPDVRGSDVLIPHKPGVVAQIRRATVTVKGLELVIFGSYDVNGAAAADRHVTLWDNIEYLRGQVTDPTMSNDGTRVATLYLPDGTTKSGDVHVLGMELSPISSWDARAVMEVSIPSGALS